MFYVLDTAFNRRFYSNLIGYTLTEKPHRAQVREIVQ